MAQIHVKPNSSKPDDVPYYPDCTSTFTPKTVEKMGFNNIPAIYSEIFRIAVSVDIIILYMSLINTMTAIAAYS